MTTTVIQRNPALATETVEVTTDVTALAEIRKEIDSLLAIDQRVDLSEIEARLGAIYEHNQADTAIVQQINEVWQLANQQQSTNEMALGIATGAIHSARVAHQEARRVVSAVKRRDTDDPIVGADISDIQEEGYNEGFENGVEEGGSYAYESAAESMHEELYDNMTYHLKHLLGVDYKAARRFIDILTEGYSRGIPEYKLHDIGALISALESD